jgi:acyl phosphate:glycerol-3-phosphate acyltransferase
MLQSFSPSLLPAYAAALVFGYLCGSVPFGLIITRLAGTRDIRSIGSGNIGATNVLRTGRKGLAAATLVGDALKGTFAVLAIYYYYGPEYRYFAHDLAIPAAFGAFLGHLFPVWLGFKGGKGVATYIGLLLALAWPVAIAFCLVWLAVAAATRYSSLAALVASAATPLALWLLGYWPEPALFALLTALLWVMHRANIARLINGTEGNIGKSAASET